MKRDNGLLKMDLERKAAPMEHGFTLVKKPKSIMV